MQSIGIFRNSRGLIRSSLHVCKLSASLVQQPIRFQSTDNTNKLSEKEQKAREQHVQTLSKYYPESLLSSIVAAESAIDPKDWAQRKPAQTQFSPIYRDDLAQYDSFYDHAQNEWTDLSKPRQQVPYELFTGGGEIPRELQDIWKTQHELGDKKVDNSLRAKSLQADIERAQRLGYSEDFYRGLKFKTIIIKRVVNQTAKGKIPSTFALVVCGNGNGMVGIGEGKDLVTAPMEAVVKAKWRAIANMVHIPRNDDRTIFGQISHKMGAVHLTLRPAPPGHGLRVNHVIADLCRCAGIKDLTGNTFHSRNPLNVIKAALEALQTKQPIPEIAAKNRGKKIVDLRQVYYTL
ncbi:hypothetical protein NADFUDRAFT_45738 [Nadsonia fulvescens var. elongata DSM 6958]|uniref:Small ribosomal subunit protein uS5m n=1 Tax=Nadsonia fulvescens var. elongata DSM 6958 TaxID=857566 RepID=A0A1E3PLX8_9ASCO|nr:hypothetical protein NADFUDRAFT_45738 [Nadsonia fulvescens var. elongata DSM 6958]